MSDHSFGCKTFRYLGLRLKTRCSSFHFPLSSSSLPDLLVLHRISSSSTGSVRPLPDLLVLTRSVLICICIWVMIIDKYTRVRTFLNDMLRYLLRNLHITQKHLQFLQSRAERSDSGKAYFLIFERSEVQRESGSLKYFKLFSLATFLAQVYLEVHEIGQELVRDPKQKYPHFLVQ
ncbi:hypothetical protein K1719_019872 [Acacia pycnantha]|nr:hypothetical protein K1719_019872 [Acacia pycnantha]